MSISDDATARLVAVDLERTRFCSPVLLQWSTAAYFCGWWFGYDKREKRVVIFVLLNRFKPFGRYPTQ